MFSAPNKNTCADFGRLGHRGFFLTLIRSQYVLEILDIGRNRHRAHPFGRIIHVGRCIVAVIKNNIGACTVLWPVIHVADIIENIIPIYLIPSCLTLILLP